MELDIQSWLPITTPTRFPLIILPDESFFHEEKTLLSDEYLDTISRIKNFAQKNFREIEQKKFYLLHGKNQFGEERLAEYFKTKGYEIIRPENFSFQEQLNILANCESLASTVGSCSHNSIFMKDESELILIPRYPESVLNGYQNALNQFSNLNINYVDANLSLFTESYHGPFYYIISKQLKKFFGDENIDEYDEEDLTTFLQYVRYSMEHGYKEDVDKKKYYSEILPDFYSTKRFNGKIRSHFKIVSIKIKEVNFW